jgi:hypothetical protein
MFVLIYELFFNLLTLKRNALIRIVAIILCPGCLEVSSRILCQTEPKLFSSTMRVTKIYGGKLPK